MELWESSFDPRFIKYYINTPSFLLKCEIVSGGTTRQRISRSNLGRLSLKVPPLPQQRRIATILTTLDEVIEATEKLVEKHQQIKAGLMHDLFTRGLWTRPELAPNSPAATTKASPPKPPPKTATSARHPKKPRTSTKIHRLV